MMSAPYTVLWDDGAESFMLEGNLDSALADLSSDQFTIKAMRSGSFGLWAVTIMRRSGDDSLVRIKTHEDFETALRLALGEHVAAERGQ